MLHFFGFSGELYELLLRDWLPSRLRRLARGVPVTVFVLGGAGMGKRWFLRALGADAGGWRWTAGALHFREGDSSSSVVVRVVARDGAAPGGGGEGFALCLHLTPPPAAWRAAQGLPPRAVDALAGASPRHVLRCARAVRLGVHVPIFNIDGGGGGALRALPPCGGAHVGFAQADALRALRALDAARGGGAVLTGVRGGGKSHVLRKFGEISRRRCMLLCCPALLAPGLGEAEARVRAAFAAARARAPALLVLEGLGALFGARSGFRFGGGEDDKTAMGLFPSGGASAGGDEHPVRARLVAALLTELDGLIDRGDVLVVGECERAAGLDAALVRAGRLGREVPVRGRGRAEEFLDELWRQTHDGAEGAPERVRRRARESDTYGELVLLAQAAAVEAVTGRAAAAAETGGARG